jgi:acyl carrier protein
MNGLKSRIFDAAVDRANLDPAQVDDNTLLSALGINSLGLIHLITLIEEREGVNLDDDAFYAIFAAVRLGEIVQVFGRLLANSSRGE